MTEVSVKDMANEMKISIALLLKQFSDAGIKKSENDLVTIQEKKTLLTYLNRSYNLCPNKLTLQRKTRSTLSIAGTGGKNKSVQVEVRKKRTFIKRDLQQEERCSFEQEKSRPAVGEYLKSLSKEKEKYDISIKNKLNNQDSKKNIKKTEKIRRENKAIEIKRKSEETARRKLEETALMIAKEARRIAEKNEKEWKNVKNINEDFNDYHLTTSRYARQAEDENDSEIESGRRYRNTKSLRPKKGNRHSEFKIDREEVRAVIRSSKNKKRKGLSLQQVFKKPIQNFSRDIFLNETISVSELANKMAVKSSHVIKVMMKLGFMVTINQILDQEIAQLVVEEMGHKAILRRDMDLEEAMMKDRDFSATEVEPRDPIVTIMGHVDHGKTSLLDCIRSTKIASGETGGITQHIGAYHVVTEKGGITFLDTPGHAAFTAMRARGTKVTDIVILVVAADDGVMPQTVEAIHHAQAAKVPIVVAINKIDKPEADLDFVKSGLSKHGIVPEEWGGDYQFVLVSAKKGIGIEELLNAILLQAEILELKAVQKGMANCVVIESFLDKGRGPIASVLVLEGTLHRGDIVICGFEYGKIRAIRDQVGKELVKVGPSIPVEILGLSGVPISGDKMTVVRDEKIAREVAMQRQEKFREIKLSNHRKSKLKNILDNMISEEIRDINLILKADVQGSVEAISDSLLNLSNNTVKIKIISSGVGGINETDATLAAASNAILIGFNVRADAAARRVIESENLDLRYYSIIYKLIDDITAEIKGFLPDKKKQKIIGLAEVRDVFRSPKFGSIAGCKVIEGIVKRHNPLRILRNNIVIYEGELESLRRFKDDVIEVRNAMECGIGVKNYNDIRAGDIIEVFEVEI